MAEGIGGRGTALAEYAPGAENSHFQLHPHADKNEPTDQGPHEYWRRRYARAVERLQQAGIKTTASGAEKYISLRAEWDQYITRLAPQFAYDMDEIDTALAKVK